MIEYILVELRSKDITKMLSVINVIENQRFQEIHLKFIAHKFLVAKLCTKRFNVFYLTLAFSLCEIMRNSQTFRNDDT